MAAAWQAGDRVHAGYEGLTGKRISGTLLSGPFPQDPQDESSPAMWTVSWDREAEHTDFPERLLKLLKQYPTAAEREASRKAALALPGDPTERHKKQRSNPLGKRKAASGDPKPKHRRVVHYVDRGDDESPDVTTDLHPAAWEATKASVRDYATREIR